MDKLIKSFVWVKTSKSTIAPKNRSYFCFSFGKTFCTNALSGMA